MVIYYLLAVYYVIHSLKVMANITPAICHYLDFVVHLQGMAE